MNSARSDRYVSVATCSSVAASFDDVGRRLQRRLRRPRRPGRTSGSGSSAPCRRAPWSAPGTPSGARRAASSSSRRTPSTTGLPSLMNGSVERGAVGRDREDLERRRRLQDLDVDRLGPRRGRRGEQRRPAPRRARRRGVRRRRRCRACGTTSRRLWRNASRSAGSDSSSRSSSRMSTRSGSVARTWCIASDCRSSDSSISPWRARSSSGIAASLSLRGVVTSTTRGRVAV